MARKIQYGKATAKNNVVNHIFAAIGIGDEVEKVQGEGEIGGKPGGHWQGAAERMQCGRFHLKHKKMGASQKPKLEWLPPGAQRRSDKQDDIGHAASCNGHVRGTVQRKPANLQA